MARDRVGLTQRARRRTIACFVAWAALGCGDDGAGSGRADAAVDAGAPPHLAAWFRCEDELCYFIADDGFELLRDGTAKELRAAREPDEDDAGVPFGEVGFSRWCEMPWGRYEFDGVTFSFDPEAVDEPSIETILDVRGDFGTFIYDDLSHTHYWRVAGTSSGACPDGTPRGLVRTGPEPWAG